MFKSPRQTLVAVGNHAILCDFCSILLKGLANVVLYKDVQLT